MAAPHPLALRRRVVDAYENGEGTYSDIAERFSVGVASVSRWVGLMKWNGSLAPKPMGGARRKSITDDMEELIRSLILDEPNWTTAELAAELNGAFGTSVSDDAVGRALKNMGFSFKRGSPDRELPDSQRSRRREPSSSKVKTGWTQGNLCSSTKQGLSET